MRRKSSIDQQRKEATYNYELINAAYHEAGHAIMGLINLTDLEDVEVNVEIDKRISKDFGYTDFLHPFGYEYTKSSLKLSKTLDESVKMTLAIADIRNHYGGLAAETILHKKLTGSDILPNVLRIGSEQDLTYISKTIKTYNLANPGQDRRNFKKDMLNHVIKYLDYFWNDVVIVAQALIKHKKLNGKQLKNILKRKSDNKEYWRKLFAKIKMILSGKENDPMIVDIMMDHLR